MTETERMEAEALRPGLLARGRGHRSEGGEEISTPHAEEVLDLMLGQHVWRNHDADANHGAAQRAAR